MKTRRDGSVQRCLERIAGSNKNIWPTLCRRRRTWLQSNPLLSDNRRRFFRRHRVAAGSACKELNGSETTQCHQIRICVSPFSPPKIWVAPLLTPEISGHPGRGYLSEFRMSMVPNRS